MARELSRAGLAAWSNQVHLDELRRPSGGDSGDEVRHRFTFHALGFVGANQIGFTGAEGGETCDQKRAVRLLATNVDTSG